MAQRYGAEPETWLRLSLIFGLTRDLLPVVSNPDAIVSPNSTMKALGKTPSKYNYNRRVVGFSAWTQHEATEDEVDMWSEEKDYGVCVQCREVMAFDGDIEGEAVARKVLAALDKYTADKLGFLLPIRTRSNSPKWLVFFRCGGDYSKRTVKVESGMVENLARGQQFILDGTHPSGERYVTDMRGCVDIPAIAPEHYEELWGLIVDTFGTSEPTGGNYTLRKKGENLNLNDETIEFLDVLAYGKSGELYVTCPFESEHTTESGITSTAYFPAGTNGYQTGHFKCLHAHCAHRTDADFLDALGVRVAGFEEINLPSKKGREPFPPLVRDKEGQAQATLNNLEAALRHSGMLGARLRHDVFREEILYSSPDREDWQPIGDTTYVNMRKRLEKMGFKPIGREIMRDSVVSIAEENGFDSAQCWLNGIQWDGKPRVERFLHTHFGAEDNDYTRAVALYMWTALAGRVLEPGIKADMVPILQGGQGLRKSAALEALVPSSEQFVEVALSDRDENLARMTKGCLVVELAELQGLRTRDIEGIKAYITKRNDKWIPKYREIAITYPRRFIFFGTTNEQEFLADPTGERRWLPFSIERTDVELIRADREQLWAEGAEIFKKQGILWGAAEKLATENQGDFKMIDPWQDVILDYVFEADAEGNPFRAVSGVRTMDILVDAVGLSPARVTRLHEMRVATVLKAMGMVNVRKVNKGVRTTVWLPREDTPPS